LTDYRKPQPSAPAPPPDIYLPEAEAGLVGGLIRDSHALPEVRNHVNAEMFFGVKYRMIWNAILDLADADEPIDALTVIERLDREGSIGARIAMADVAQIVVESPSAANVVNYAKMVSSRAHRRTLQALGGEAAKWAETEPDPAKIITRIQERLEQVSVEREENGPKPLGSLMLQSLDILDRRANQPPGRTGLPTGLPALDDLIDGLCPGRLYVTAARPGVGKSILGLQFARCAIHAGKSAGLWSLEMPNDEVVSRLWAAERDISFRKIQTANLQPNDWAALNDVSAQLKDHKLWIDDTESLQLAELLSRIRALHRRHSLD
jgi:replicative DNA helicase